jgi:hypothetical protein
MYPFSGAVLALLDSLSPFSLSLSLLGAQDGNTPPDCVPCDVLEPLPSSRRFPWEYRLADAVVSCFFLHTGPISGAALSAAAAGEFIMTSPFRD